MEKRLWHAIYGRIKDMTIVRARMLNRLIRGEFNLMQRLINIILSFYGSMSPYARISSLCSAFGIKSTFDACIRKRDVIFLHLYVFVAKKYFLFKYLYGGIF